MINQIKDLEKIRESQKEILDFRMLSTEDTSDILDQMISETGRYDIALCMGTSCQSSKSTEVAAALEKEIAKYRLEDKVTIVRTGCNGFCAVGPIMVMYPGGVLYNGMDAEDVPEIFEEHIINHRLVERCMYHHPVSDAVIPKYMDLPFFAKQELRVLRNKGIINADSIEEYIGRDGYFGFARALTELSPEDVIDEVKSSGLRGRGGGGFLTGLKWSFCKNSQSDKKYILCNADEGDPGAFMDRSILESDPHSVIEGMLIGAYAIGADEGFIYCRAEYPLALTRLETAIANCEKNGLLGKNILGTGFNFKLNISRGSGAFVCGEETALMNSIEGRRGEPRPRPPFPAVKGLWGKPSVLNNVETFANIPLIMFNGYEWYRTTGTENSPGTKIFALTGNVRNVGLVEVPIGTSLGDLIFEIGGGMQEGKVYKSAQIGGPSGGCIPKSHLSVSLDFESLQELGAIMGSGGLVVMSEDTCMVDVAKFFLEFVLEESCGKCVPCRVGIKRMHEILERITTGYGEEEDIDKLIKLGTIIKQTSLCGLGQTAPNPVLSTIQHFRHEYEDHIVHKHCEAGVCPGLVRAPCQSACPAGVDIPGFIALIKEKRYAEALKLHREKNPFAAICARVCFHTCEDKCRRAMLDEPVSIRALKRYLVEQEIVVQLPEILENNINAAKKVAVIGAGPAGLSCAYFLARLGYKPVVYESESRPGGMLTQAIPAYRLPREEIAREIRMIERIGVEINCETVLGRDISIQQLRDNGFEAIFLAAGAPVGSSLGIPGEEADGVDDALNFLRHYNIRGNVRINRNVLVIGGGNAAIDAARTAIRLGAESVTIVYRRKRSQMPAYQEEVEEAIVEGVKLVDLTQPVEVVKSADGKVAGLKCLHMTLGDFDKQGRRRAVKENEEYFILKGDQIITAIGQGIDKSIFNDIEGLEFNEKGYIKIDKSTGKTSINWLYAGGDNCSGPASVVKAIHAGEVAAVGIDYKLSGEDHAFWREERKVETAFDPDADPVPYPREKSPLIPAEKRRANFDEVELPWSEAVAMRQSARCLRCDYGKPAIPREVIND
ncbi:MAG: NADH-ubiquinone oxidoreductase-F iron-sulfur binding region domain-containing protein [Spirochaetales bacterium]|uniref:NADH-ubiquinone oxidoreductase-F iron-sulfur binding region domain-containing protein n=1 Tax=Candidatus Thalassospirochaeta sargassi TaxID=3119039 RepID=A0AAJ1IG01_9SPIO|nr:NADH-ubiquinone oxidoreductase-F iron-sulfur binding region domain-containing protein [Spirochaetales bacterium]